jgi:hypothetical protein
MLESHSSRPSFINTIESGQTGISKEVQSQVQEHSSPVGRLKSSSSKMLGDTTLGYLVLNSPYRNKQGLVSAAGGDTHPIVQAATPQPGKPETRPAETTPLRDPIQINNLIRSEQGLGSENYRQRTNAQRQLEQAGVYALPSVLAALHDRTNPVPLEVQRRCESICNSMLGKGMGDLIAATRSADFALSTSAQALLSRQSTEALLMGSTYNQLSAENQRTFNQLITTRLNEDQLHGLTERNSFGKFGQASVSTDERTLRLAVAAEQVLGQTASPSHYGLGTLLFDRGRPEEQSYAESLLNNYRHNGNDPLLQASAHRMIAASAFRRGDTAQGLTLTQDGMRLLENAANDPSHDLILQEFRQFSSLTQGASGMVGTVTAAQTEELSQISQRASEAAINYTQRHRAWLESMTKKIIKVRD